MRSKRKRSTTLERLRKAAPPGSSAHDHVGRAFGARTNGMLSLAAMELAAKRFVTWREAELRQRGDRDAYGLLVERVRAGEADDLAPKPQNPVFTHLTRLFNYILLKSKS